MQLVRLASVAVTIAVVSLIAIPVPALEDRLAPFRIYSIDKFTEALQTQSFSEPSVRLWGVDLAANRYGWLSRLATPFPGRIVFLQYDWPPDVLLDAARGTSFVVHTRHWERFRIATTSRSGRFSLTIPVYFDDSSTVVDLDQPPPHIAFEIESLVPHLDGDETNPRRHWNFTRSVGAFAGDDLLVVTAAIDNVLYGDVPPSSEIYLFGIDLDARTVVFEFTLPADTIALAFDETGSELRTVRVGEIVHYAIPSGDRIRSSPHTYSGGAYVFLEDHVVAHGANWFDLFDLSTGRLVRQWRGAPAACQTLVSDDSGIGFVIDCTGEELRAIDLFTVEELGRIPLPDDSRSVQVGVVPHGWTPPPTRTTTPTPTQTPLPTATPTPTACQAGCVEVRIEAPREVRPGEVVPISFHVDTNGRDISNLAVGYSVDSGLLWDVYRNGELRCRSGSHPTELHVTIRSTMCSVSQGYCRVGGFEIERPWRRPGIRQVPVPGYYLPLPGQMRIDCAVEIDRHATPGTYPWHFVVTSRESSPNGRPNSSTGGEVFYVRGLPVAFTPTPTATPASTPQPTPTYAPGTPAAAPCVGCSHIAVRDVRVRRGGFAVLEVRLDASRDEISAVQADIALPTELVAPGASSWRCRGNPFLPQRVAFREHHCGDGSCRVMRAILYGLADANVSIPDQQLLWTCRIAIRNDAPVGRHMPRLSRTLASDREGTAVGLGAAVGVFEVVEGNR